MKLRSRVLHGLLGVEPSATGVGHYTAICEWVDGWYEITVPEIDSVTQARSLDDVSETVNDLVILMTGHSAKRIDVRWSTTP